MAKLRYKFVNGAVGDRNHEVRLHAASEEGYRAMMMSFDGSQVVVLMALLREGQMAEQPIIGETEKREMTRA